MKLAESIAPEAFPVFAGTERGSQNMADTSDAALAASLPGHFRNGYGEVNGTRIHYVEGGKGTPVLLLPGWPQTWWEFHKIMPELAKRHRVIAVDLRGMGGSAKPGSGYDKKNMAKDIHELTRALGYKQVNIAGHDIGAMVAYSFAANYPDATLKISLIDVAHPEELVIDRLAVLLDQQDRTGNLFGRDFVAEELADLLELLLVEMRAFRNVEGAFGHSLRPRRQHEQRGIGKRKGKRTQ